MMEESKGKGKKRSSYPSRTGFRPTQSEISPNPVHRISIPKSPTPSTNCSQTPMSTICKSDPIPINSEISIDFDQEQCCQKSLSCPDHWAGPTYPNSPPASSLPMPKFLNKRKRNVSFESITDLVAGAVENVHPIVKSAPPSPMRARYNSSKAPIHGAATSALRRILKLDDDSE